MYAWRKKNTRRGKKNAAKKKKCAPDPDIWRRKAIVHAPAAVTHSQEIEPAHQPGSYAQKGISTHSSTAGGTAGQGLVRWVLWCIILVLPLAVGPLAVGRWSLIGVRAVGVCLYTEARILHFALITALAARARSERRGGGGERQESKYPDQDGRQAGQ